MEIQKGTPTKSITVQGFPLEVPTPFAEGHPLSESEAAVLNQTLAENLRNNFGSQLKKLKEEAEAEGNEYAPDAKKLQAAFNDYIKDYEFGAKRGGGGGTSLDPVERKALSLSREAIKRAIQNKGVKIKDVGNEKLTELVNSYYEANKDTLMAQARDLIAAEEKARDAMASVNVDI